MHYETVWKFETARFTVALEVAPEDMDPAEQFDDEVAEEIRNGSVDYFQARVSVYLDGKRIAADCLGGCAYKSVNEFRTMHIRYKQGDYFSDMVACAISEARKSLCNTPKLRRA